MTRPFLFVSVTALALAACSGASTRAAHQGDLIFAVGSEGSSFFVVDPTSGHVIARPGPLPAERAFPVLSADSSTLFFRGQDNSGGVIFALDARDFTLRRWLELGFPPPRAPLLDSLYVFGLELAVVPGDAHLYDGSAYRADANWNSPVRDQRIAVMSATASRVEDTIGPPFTHGLAALPAGAVAPHGGLIAIGNSRKDRAVLGVILVIDPATRAVIDSVVVPAPSTGEGGSVFSIRPSPDGRRIYLLGAYGLYGYDLLDRQLFGTALRNNFLAPLAISPDGARLYTVYGGNQFLEPGEIHIRVFDASLVEQAPISLAGESALQGWIPQLRDIAVSRDGRSLYMASGAGYSGSPTKNCLLVLDLASGVITRVIPLGEYRGEMKLVVGR